MTMIVRALRHAAIATLLVSAPLLIGQQEKSPKSAEPTVAGQSAVVPLQANVSEPQFKLQSNVQLVLVPALVTDHAGNHVPGLAASDFSIKDNGKVYPVKFVQEIKTPTQQTFERVKLPAGTYSNNRGDAKAPLRVVIILFDMLNSHFKDQVPARIQVEKYLREQTDPGTMVALLGLGRGGLRMYHDLTSDTKGLADELQTSMELGRHSISTHLDQETSDTESEAAFVGHGQFAQTGSSGRSSRKLIILDTLDAFRNIAGAYASIPGRKSLIWVTGGFPFTIDGSKAGGTGLAAMDQDGVLDVLPDYQKTWEKLNDANMALYPVDMHGLVNTAEAPASYKTKGSGGGGGGGGSKKGGGGGGGHSRGGGGKGGGTAKEMANYESDKQDKLEDNLATFQTFALETGGKAFYNNNDLVEGFRQAAGDSRSSYLLAYSPGNDAAPGWHSLHVEANRPGLHIRARAGYLVAKHDAAHPDKADAPDGDVQLAMASPMSFTAIPITIRWLGTSDVSAKPGDAAAVTTPASNKRTVNFQIALPAHVIQVDDSQTPGRISLNFVGLARTETVADAGDFVKKIEGPMKPDVLHRINEAGLKFDSSIALEPGSYNVRFVVRDNVSGYVGSVTAPVVVK